MGQKVNPLGFRLGVNRTWDSRWYADKESFGGIVGIIMGVAGGNMVALVFNIPAVIPIDWAVIG